MTYSSGPYHYHVSEPDELDTEYQVQVSRRFKNGHTLFAHASHSDLETAERNALSILKRNAKERGY